MTEAGERLAGDTQQRVVVHARQGDALATLARQRVIAQHHQRLIGWQPLQRQREHHPPEASSVQEAREKKRWKTEMWRAPMAPAASATSVTVRRPWHCTQPSISHSNVS